MAHAGPALQGALAAALPGVPFVGATSCLGVGTTGAGFVGGRAVTGMFLAGDGFEFAVACGARSGSPAALGAGLGRALTGVIPRPRFALMHATPGHEEGVLAALVGELGRGAELIGGTAADDDLTGRWYVFSHEGVVSDGVAVAACDWPWRLATHYQGGYVPTDKRGTITRSTGRELLEIDGQPAAAVYNGWIGGALDAELAHGGNVLAKTTLCPLGVVRDVGGAELHVLAHPERVDPHTGGLRFFAELGVGERVVLMRSTPTALERRGANVAERALTWAKLDPRDVLGGVFIYCGGCLLAIADRARPMVQAFDDALGARPFVSHFAFGEQGCVFPSSPADHGNLMASVLLLSALPER